MTVDVGPVTPPGFSLADFTLPADREAHDPPEARGLARDGVRMLVSRAASGEIGHHAFGDLPGLLLPGDRNQCRFPYAEVLAADTIGPGWMPRCPCNAPSHSTTS